VTFDLHPPYPDADMPPRCFLILALFGVVFAGGCGSRMAKVKGRVTCNGQPFPNASVTFSPIPTSEADRDPGRAAGGGTDGDGRYVLTTQRQGDGIIVGKHRVTIGVEYPEKPYPCKGHGEIVVEVKPGSNVIDIELSQYQKK
jgi:hypothetical protein